MKVPMIPRVPDRPPFPVGAGESRDPMGDSRRIAYASALGAALGSVSLALLALRSHPTALFMLGVSLLGCFMALGSAIGAIRRVKAARGLVQGDPLRRRGIDPESSVGAGEMPQ